MIRHDECIMVIGRRGCGKTHLAKNLQKLWPKKIIIDTLEDYDANETTAYNFEDFTKLLLELHARNASEFTVIFKFSPESRDSETEFDEICRLAWYYGNVQVVAEEVQTHASPQYVSHWLKNLMLKGRHRGISVLATTQRPGELNKTIYSQCSHVFCGSLNEPNDLQYMSRAFNQPSETFLNLQDRRFLYKSTHGITEVGNEF